jgi:hypothetical protein
VTTYDAGCDSVEGGNGAPLLAIDLVTPAGNRVNGGIGCDEPTGIAAAPDGTLFVAVRTEKGAVQIVKVDPATGKRTTVSRGRLLRDPQGLAMTKSGDRSSPTRPAASCASRRATASRPRSPPGRRSRASTPSRSTPPGGSTRSRPVRRPP